MSPDSLLIRPIAGSLDNQVTSFGRLLKLVDGKSVHCAIDPDQRPFLNNQPSKKLPKVLVLDESPVVFAPSSRTTA